VDSQKTDIYLCRNCANENAASKIKAAFGFTDVMPSHLVFGADHGFYVKQAETESCDECGITLAEIQRSGKLGCAYCYTAFRGKLRPIITRIHRSAQHRGKTPASAQKNGAANAAGKNNAATAAGRHSADGTVDKHNTAGANAPGTGVKAGTNAPGTGAKAGTNAPGAGTNTGTNAPDARTGSGAVNDNGGKPGALSAADNKFSTGTYVGSRDRLKRLRALLTNAIHNEEYEKAAEIRDQIKAIEADSVDYT